MKQYLLLALCWLAFSAHGKCSAEGRAGDDTSTIALPTTPPDEFYYFRVADHYAILVEPQTLGRRMAEQVARGGPYSGERLLKDIRDETIPGLHKDLFDLVLKDPLYFTSIERLLAEVLQRGEAVVVDAQELAGDGTRFLPSIVRTQITGHQYEGRQFCTQNGDLLLHITDEIV